MSESQTTQPTNRGLRTTVLAYACILGGFSVWILATEVLRPKTIDFTTDGRSAALDYESRNAAVKAARIGIVRGDLWSDAAFAYGDVNWNLGKNASNAAVLSFEQTRAVIERALAHAPYNSRLWLLLAANYFQFDWLSERAVAALKMSYYTGSNSIVVIPQRLLLAIQSHALDDDDEFQELVRNDIRVSTNHKARLISALVTAYNNAPQAGRQFIEKALGDINPGMLTTIRSGKEHR